MKQKHIGIFLKRGAVQPRAAVFGTLLLLALGTGSYFLAPWILPVRIIEGPMVQQAGETELTLVWYASRPVACELVVSNNGVERVLPAETTGKRGRVRVTGLAPNQTYPYQIRAAGRVLAAAAFRTNKPAGQPFRFVVFGDSGRGTRAQYGLAEQIRALSPDFILHTGDLVYGRGDRGDYTDRFFTPYRESLARINFWPCLGNHDVSKPSFGAAYRDVFELPENGPAGQPPEHHYWFDYASARIAVIDSNMDESVLQNTVAPWLREVMGKAGDRWKFVSLHHPAYSVGQYRNDAFVRRTLVPAFEAAGIHIVFCGHDHLFERTYPLRGGQIAQTEPGIVYIVSGAGGAELYKIAPPSEWPPFMAFVNNQIHGFTYVEINGDRLRLRQIALGGAVLDECALERF